MVPRAARDEVVGWETGVLRVRVTAPPVEGQANRAVTAVIARALGIRPSAVSVVRGERGRDKMIRIEGMTIDEAARRLGAAAREKE